MQKNRFPKALNLKEILHSFQALKEWEMPESAKGQDEKKVSKNLTYVSAHKQYMHNFAFHSNCFQIAIWYFISFCILGSA